MSEIDFYENSNNGLMLCVDFGTTNSVVSFYDNDKEEVVYIPIDGSNVLPTAILFEKEDDEIKVTTGSQAKNASLIFPESTVLSVKSLLGKKDKVTVNIDNKNYIFTPTQIVGLILSDIKQKANFYIQTELGIDNIFDKLVITVPANSSDKQKKKTKDAAKLAGFKNENIYIRLEPSAAAIGYAVTSTSDSKVMIYDFGGGTFDICLLDIKMDNKKPVVSIKNTAGDNNLGGNDIDKIILDIIYCEFLKITDNKIDLFNDDYSVISKRQKSVALARITQVSTFVKERLSKTLKAKVSLAPLLNEPFIVNINMEITQEMFINHRRVNQLGDSDFVFEKYKDKNLGDMISMTINEIDSCLKDADMDSSMIDEVFLVGGSSGIPMVFEKVTEYFGFEPYKAKLSPALAISGGASIYSKLIQNPESNVVKYIETTVHSLGLEILGRRYLEIISPNTFIPEEGLTVTADQPFITSSDFVNKMVIVVYEYTKKIEKNVISVSEKGMLRLCGTTLEGIPEKPNGEEKVEITFNISRDNILNVTAKSCSLDGAYTTLTVDELY